MKRLMIAIVIALLFVGCAHSPRPWTKEEKLTLIPSALSVITDYKTTVDGLDRGAEELNPCFSKHPDKSELLFKGAIAYGIVLLSAHYFPNWRGQILGFQIGWCTSMSFYDSKNMGR